VLNNNHFSINIFDPYICHAGAENLSGTWDHDRLVFTFVPVDADKTKLSRLYFEFGISLKKGQENIIY
jgi:hypothetical protein